MSDKPKDYDVIRFRNYAEKALETVTELLDGKNDAKYELLRSMPFEDQFYLMDVLTNTYIVSVFNALEKMGLSSQILSQVASDDEKNAVLQFQAQDACTLLKEHLVSVPDNSAAPIGVSQEKVPSSTSSFFGSTSSSSSSSSMSASQPRMRQIREYHWKIQVHWQVALLLKNKDPIILSSRNSSSIIITQKSKPPIPPKTQQAPVSVNLDWLLRHIIKSDKITASFKLTKKDKTPRRNSQIEQAVAWSLGFLQWCQQCNHYFTKRIDLDIMRHHQPVNAASNTSTNDLKFSSIAKPATYEIFVPIIPLVVKRSKNSTKFAPISADVDFIVNLPKFDNIISTRDMSKLIHEQIRTISALHLPFPAKQVVKLQSIAEANNISMWFHLQQIIVVFQDAVNHVEYILYQQVQANIKNVDLKNLEYSDILEVPPKPFCYAAGSDMKRTPHGFLKIVNGTKPISTLVRETQHTTCELKCNEELSITLNGSKFVHGWLRSGKIEPKSHAISDQAPHNAVAKSRQYGSIILIVGHMLDGNQSTLQPTRAIVIQDKASVVVPLFLSSGTDAPKDLELEQGLESLSPTQQEFVKSVQSQDTGSKGSTFAMVVVPVPPQLEQALNLPRNSLDKEFKLVKQLTSLFCDYQIPPEVLGFDKDQNNSTLEDQVSSVKLHVQAVQDEVDTARASKSTGEAIGSSLEQDRQQQFMMQQQQQQLQNQKEEDWDALAKQRTLSAAMSTSIHRPVDDNLVVAADGNDNNLPFPSPMATASDSIIIDFDPDTVTTTPPAIPSLMEFKGLKVATIQAGKTWKCTKQTNLLSPALESDLTESMLQSETLKAFDLLNAFGCVTDCQIHVIHCVTHTLEQASVLESVIEENINPMESLQDSTIYFASFIYKKPVSPRLIRRSNEAAQSALERLTQGKDSDDEFEEGIPMDSRVLV